jgi:glucose-6-phosphate 1-dehydrogenase
MFQEAPNGQTRPPTLFVIFGAQGDLTKRKLIPALYNLAASRHLPQEFAILGVDGVSMTTEDFRLKISRDLQELSTRPIRNPRELSLLYGYGPNFFW